MAMVSFWRSTSSRGAKSATSSVAGRQPSGSANSASATAASLMGSRRAIGAGASGGALPTLPERWPPPSPPRRYHCSLHQFHAQVVLKCRRTSLQDGRPRVEAAGVGLPRVHRREGRRREEGACAHAAQQAIAPAPASSAERSSGASGRAAQGGGGGRAQARLLGLVRRHHHFVSPLQAKPGCRRRGWRRMPLPACSVWAAGAPGVAGGLLGQRDLCERPEDRPGQQGPALARRQDRAAQAVRRRRGTAVCLHIPRPHCGTRSRGLPSVGRPRPAVPAHHPEPGQHAARPDAPSRRARNPGAAAQPFTVDDRQCSQHDARRRGGGQGR
eukprot:scaffold4636_cov81-Isochrysis_galbana.AAC.5